MTGIKFAVAYPAVHIGYCFGYDKIRYRPLAFFDRLLSGLRAGHGSSGRAAETATDAHGDAAAVDEVAREIGDDGQYDDDD